MAVLAKILPSLFASAILFLVIAAIQTAFGWEPYFMQSVAFFFFLAAELLGIMAFVIFNQRHWSTILSVTLASLFLILMIVKPFL